MLFRYYSVARLSISDGECSLVVNLATRKQTLLCYQVDYELSINYDSLYQYSQSFSAPSPTDHCSLNNHHLSLSVLNIRAFCTRQCSGLATVLVKVLNMTAHTKTHTITTTKDKTYQP